jgi:hypothetical protein
MTRLDGEIWICTAQYGITCDIHDNVKDISGVEGSLLSPTTAAEAMYAPALSVGGSNITQEHDSTMSLSTTTNLNYVDAGMVAASKDIALEGLSYAGLANKDAYAAYNTYAEKIAELGKQSQQGEAATLLKPLLIGAAVIAAIIFGFKALGAWLGGRKKAAT